ncbi:MAG TPA: hypothetical protein VEM76_01145 [Anaeromyxobacteraceae bacterium]|nr:hypothetical protein [Anaeromyxobacteraceae bacterium]
MLTHFVAAGLALALAAGDSGPIVGGKAAASARLARTEAEQCLASCPAMPALPSNDWLRSVEGRKTNACPMACRTEQPAAAVFRSLADLATSNKPDPEAAIVKAAGKDGPEYLRRLRQALREADGQRLGPLCSKARSNLRPADEAIYVECTGRVGASDPFQGLAPVDATRAPRCAAVFAERDLDWFKRCGGMEARAAIDVCVEQAVAKGRQSAASARNKCESDVLDRMESALPARGRP